MTLWIISFLSENKTRMCRPFITTNRITRHCWTKQFRWMLPNVLKRSNENVILECALVVNSNRHWHCSRHMHLRLNLRNAAYNCASKTSIIYCISSMTEKYCIDEINLHKLWIFGIAKRFRNRFGQNQFSIEISDVFSFPISNPGTQHYIFMLF